MTIIGNNWFMHDSTSNIAAISETRFYIIITFLMAFGYNISHT